MNVTIPTKKEALKLAIVWGKTDDVDYPYEAKAYNHKWRLRLNDFPDEPLFTIFIDEMDIGDFDDWPRNWKR